MGGAWALDGLWRALKIDRTLGQLLDGRRLDARAERVIFAMVANRALEPLSKLAASKWVTERAWIDGLAELDEDACYRAMDWLLEVEDELAEQVYFETADLLNLEVDLLFFDTTSTYFERDEPEQDVVDQDGNVIGPAFRVRGHSKDHRPDLPQVVIGMAVTRTGIPIRVWCWPGNSSDQELIRQVKDDLGPGSSRAWCGLGIAGSSRRRTAGTCSAPAGTTSSGRSCAATTRKPTPRSPAKAATTPSRRTSASRRS